MLPIPCKCPGMHYTRKLGMKLPHLISLVKYSYVWQVRTSAIKEVMLIHMTTGMYKEDLQEVMLFDDND